MSIVTIMTILYRTFFIEIGLCPAVLGSHFTSISSALRKGATRLSAADSLLGAFGNNEVVLVESDALLSAFNNCEAVPFHWALSANSLITATATGSNSIALFLTSA